MQIHLSAGTLLSGASLALGVLALAACGDESSAARPPGECPKLWQGRMIGRAAGSVAVEGGALTMRLTDGTHGEVIIAHQDRAASGDFAIQILFADFVRNNVGGTVEGFLSRADAPEGAASARALIDRNSVDAAVAGTDGNTTSDYELEDTATGGAFLFERAGTALVATAQAGESEASASGTFDADEVIVQIKVTNRSSTPADVSIGITAFEVSAGGGTLQSDFFGCNSFGGMVEP